jgi:hypothetical protein
MYKGLSFKDEEGYPWTVTDVELTMNHTYAHENNPLPNGTEARYNVTLTLKV